MDLFTLAKELIVNVSYCCSLLGLLKCRKNTEHWKTAQEDRKKRITNILVVSVAQLVARRTHDRKVVGSIPLTQCVSQLSGKPPGVNCRLWPATTPSSEL